MQHLMYYKSENSDIEVFCTFLQGSNIDFNWKSHQSNLFVAKNICMGLKSTKLSIIQNISTFTHMSISCLR